jgi:hypothetical protein
MSVVRRAVILLPCAVLLSAGAALALKTGPVKGAKYAGTVHGEAVTLTVAANGKSATPHLQVAPPFCQGGGGGEVPHPHSSPIGKDGSYTTTIPFTVEGSGRQFATITIKGTFLGKAFDGQLKSSFKPAVTCNGQTSFSATTSK